MSQHSIERRTSAVFGEVLPPVNVSSYGQDVTITWAEKDGGEVHVLRLRAIEAAALGHALLSASVPTQAYRV